MKKTFLPAAHFDVLTPCYDPFARLLFGRIYRDIAKTIHPKTGQKILDIGCGSGLLIQALKQVEPEMDITGIDIDPQILVIETRKFRRKAIDAKLIQGSATNIPLQEKFDVIVSTLMIHHLQKEQKIAMLREARRLLKPDGAFYLFDFGPPRTVFEKFTAKILRFFEPIDDGITGRYRDYLHQAGFKKIHTLLRRSIFELLNAA